MKKKDIDPEKPNVHEVFSITGGLRYIIPRYQRAYAWDKENGEKLWKDINNVLLNQDNDYFIGTMVLSQTEDSTNIEVIDGQQRLTTLSLLLLSLYLHYAELDSSKASKHILKYLKIGDIDDEYEVLTLSRVNLSLFSELLNINSIKEYKQYKEKKYKNEIKSNKCIFDVLDYFIEEIEQGKISDHNLEMNRLNELLKIIRNNIFFLTLKVTDYAEASKLFEVLNNRGVDLTKADLIKNHLFAQAEKQSSLVTVEKNWNKLEDNIGIDKLEQFFRYFSLIYSKNDDMYVRMEETIHNKSALTVSNLIVEHSDRYKVFLEPSYSSDDKESLLYEELKILGVSQFYSFILATYDKFSFSEIINLLEYVLKFTFRYSTICGKNPNRLESLYAELAYKINDGKCTIDFIKEEILKLNPSEQEFKLFFLEKEFKSTKIPRYILGKIEESISTNEKTIDFDAVHLEHIMPKKIDKWKTVNVKYEKLHQKYLHQIGNMTLLSEKINTSIKNDIFSRKIIKYKESEINIIKHITSFSDWDEKEINETAQYYFKCAEKIWKLSI